MGPSGAFSPDENNLDADGIEGQAGIVGMIITGRNIYIYVILFVEGRQENGSDRIK